VVRSVWVGMNTTRSQLLLEVCKYIHSGNGWVMGQAVRYLFMFSKESESDIGIDCVFETCEDANLLIRVLKVSGTVHFEPTDDSNPRQYRLFKVSKFQDTIELRIHHYYCGLTRGTKIPKHGIFPTFDIDCVLWTSGGIREHLPPKFKKEELGLQSPSSFALMMRHVQSQSFSIINDNILNDLRAAIVCFDQCCTLIEQGFVMERNRYNNSNFPVLYRCGSRHDNDEFLCSIRQVPCGRETIIIQLPCNHEFTYFQGLRDWIKANSGPDSSSVSCPLCKSVFLDVGNAV